MFERIRNMRLALPPMPERLRRIGPATRRVLHPLHPYIERTQKLATPAWQTGAGWYEKREPREKLLLRVLALVVACLLVYGLVYAPIIGLRDDLAERVVTRRQDLLAIRTLTRTYTTRKRELAAVQKRTVPSGRDFSLFSIIEQTLSKSVGREHIGSITPNDHPVPGGFRQYVVDVKLTGILLPQIVDTLYGVQALSVPVAVSDLQIHQRARNTHSYDVDMTCTALGKDG